MAGLFPQLVIPLLDAVSDESLLEHGIYHRDLTATDGIAAATNLGGDGPITLIGELAKRRVVGCTCARVCVCDAWATRW